MAAGAFVTFILSQNRFSLFSLNNFRPCESSMYKISDYRSQSSQSKGQQRKWKRINFVVVEKVQFCSQSMHFINYSNHTIKYPLSKQEKDRDTLAFPWYNNRTINTIKYHFACKSLMLLEYSQLGLCLCLCVKGKS